jgi:hypothetical protein
MTVSQIQSRLESLNATEYEAELLGSIMYLGGWHTQPATKITNEQREAMRVWLEDFRAERAILANMHKAERATALAAGYRVAECKHRGDTFRLNGIATCLHCGEQLASNTLREVA